MHNVCDPSSLARTRELFSMSAQCPRKHRTDPPTRFLVLARNDAVAKCKYPLPSVLPYKSRVDTPCITDA